MGQRQAYKHKGYGNRGLTKTSERLASIFLAFQEFQLSFRNLGAILTRPDGLTATKVKPKSQSDLRSQSEHENRS